MQLSIEEKDSSDCIIAKNSNGREWQLTFNEDFVTTLINEEGNKGQEKKANLICGICKLIRDIKNGSKLENVNFGFVRVLPDQVKQGKDPPDDWKSESFTQDCLLCVQITDIGSLYFQNRDPQPESNPSPEEILEKRIVSMEETIGKLSMAFAHLVDLNHASQETFKKSILPQELPFIQSGGKPTSSSDWSTAYDCSNAIMGKPSVSGANMGWCPKHPFEGQYLEVFFYGFYRKVTKVEVQGRGGSKDWPTEIEIHGYVNGEWMLFHRGETNIKDCDDICSVSVDQFSEKVKGVAGGIRIYPTKFHYAPSLRCEVWSQSLT